jgi:hypothetical protein
VAGLVPATHVLIDPFISATRPNNDFVDAAEAFRGEVTVKNKARGPLL